ncbi:MAG TPA: hypothetical protein VF941_16005 [Clostridia bacterium]
MQEKEKIFSRIIISIMIFASAASLIVVPFLLDRNTNIIVTTLDSYNASGCGNHFLSNQDYLRTDYSLDDNVIKEMVHNPQNYKVIDYNFNVKNISNKRCITDVEITPVFNKENKNIVIGISKYLREGYLEIWPGGCPILWKSIIVKTNDSNEELIKKFRDTKFVIKGSSWIPVLVRELYYLENSRLDCRDVEASFVPKLLP